MESGFADWLTKGIMGVLMAIIAFFTKQVVHDVNKLKETQQSDKLDLANYKTEVANNYATQNSVQQSLSRIHDRIDDISGDIKKLLAREK